MTIRWDLCKLYIERASLGISQVTQVTTLCVGLKSEVELTILKLSFSLSFSVSQQLT